MSSGRPILFLLPLLYFFIKVKMLVLYETAMGYCLFKVSDSAKIESADLWKEFESPEKASKLCVSTWRSEKIVSILFSAV